MGIEGKLLVSRKNIVVSKDSIGIDKDLTKDRNLNTFKMYCKRRKSSARFPDGKARNRLYACHCIAGNGDIPANLLHAVLTWSDQGAAHLRGSCLLAPWRRMATVIAPASSCVGRNFFSTFTLRSALENGSFSAGMCTQIFKVERGFSYG